MTEAESADAYCRVLASSHYENFSVASRIVRQPARMDLMRFYAFCRTTDDLGDESSTPQQALARLSRWREQTESFFSGEPPVHPVFVALRKTLERCPLEKQPFLDLIAANEQDQRICRYENWPQLKAYCMLSAAPVGRVVLRLFGIANARTQPLSDDVCIGLQLANHAQDVTRDARIGRQYLPEEHVRAYGIRGAVESLVVRARSLLASGEKLELFAPASLRLQLALYRLGGLAVCDEIAAMRYATEVRRPYVSKRAKVAVLLRAMKALALRRAGEGNAETA